MKNACKTSSFPWYAASSLVIKFLLRNYAFRLSESPLTPSGWCPELSAVILGFQYSRAKSERQPRLNHLRNTSSFLEPSTNIGNKKCSQPGHAKILRCLELGCTLSGKKIKNSVPGFCYMIDLHGRPQRGEKEAVTGITGYRKSKISLQDSWYPVLEGAFSRCSSCLESVQNFLLDPLRHCWCLEKNKKKVYSFWRKLTIPLTLLSSRYIIQ